MGRGRKKLSIDVKIARLEAQLKELKELKNADANRKGILEPVVEPIEPETEVEPV